MVATSIWRLEPAHPEVSIAVRIAKIETRPYRDHPSGAARPLVAWSFWKIFADEARIVYSQAHRRPRASWRVEVGQARGICGPISIAHRGSSEISNDCRIVDVLGLVRRARPSWSRTRRNGPRGAGHRRGAAIDRATILYPVLAGLYRRCVGRIVRPDFQSFEAAFARIRPCVCLGAPGSHWACRLVKLHGSCPTSRFVHLLWNRRPLDLPSCAVLG